MDLEWACSPSRVGWQWMDKKRDGHTLQTGIWHLYLVMAEEDHRRLGNWALWVAMIRHHRRVLPWEERSHQRR